MRKKKKIRELERNLPLTPKDITLSLNLKLQNIARTELANRKGAIIALDPNTGFIKAMVSSPDYNPNTLNGSEIGSSFEDYLQEDSPFFNRAISGSYPPASTIKPFVGLLGLEEGVITEDTKIEDNVIIGGNSAVQQFTRVGRSAMIGGSFTGLITIVTVAESESIVVSFTV